MRGKDRTSILNTDDRGTAIFRGRTLVLYVEDRDINYYKGIIKKIIPQNADQVKVFPPDVSLENLDDIESRIILKKDIENRGKSGVLKLHDEAIQMRKKNIFFVIDADYDLILELFSEEHSQSSQLHILNVYSIENYYVHKSIATERIENKMDDIDSFNYKETESFIQYDKWEKNIVSAFRVLLPYLLAAHYYNENYVSDGKYLETKTANIDILSFFTFKNEKVELNYKFVTKEFFEMIKIKWYKALYTKYEKLVKNMSADEVLANIQGKTILNLFLHFLYDISCELNGQSRCDSNCGTCDDIEYCRKINYKNKMCNFRLDFSGDIFFNPKFDSFEEFIRTSLGA